MKESKTSNNFNNQDVILYCEKHGIYELYDIKGNIITYYSYFGTDGFYKIIKNIKTGKEIRKSLRYKKVPKFLLTPEGYLKYNYFAG